MKKEVLLFFMFLLVLCITHASTFNQVNFYVDPDYSGTGDGSESRPWKKLDDSAWNKINTQLTTDNVIVFVSAREASSDVSENYNGGISVKRTDKSMHRLTIDGMSRYNANDASPDWRDYVGDAKCRLVDTGGHAIGWNHVRMDYITLRGFDVSGYQGRVTFGGNHLIIEDIYSHDVTDIGPSFHLQYAYDEGDGCNIDGGIYKDIIIRYNVIENTYGEAIYLGGTQNWENGCQKNSHSGIKVYGNTIRNAGSDGGEGDGIDIKDGLTNVEVYGNLIENSHQSGIHAYGVYSGANSQKLHIHDNVIKDAQGRGIMFTAALDENRIIHGATIENNIVTGSKSIGISLTGTGTASVNDVELLGNTVYGNQKGIDIGNSDDVLIRNNLVFNNQENQLSQWDSTNIDSDYNAYAAGDTWGFTSEGSHTISDSAGSLVLDYQNDNFRPKPSSKLCDNGQSSIGKDIGALPCHDRIPEERLPSGGWEEIIWEDAGGWTTIDVTTKGITPNSGDVTTKLKTLIDSLDSPTILYFPPGRYIVNNLYINYKNNGLILRGSGQDTLFDITTGGKAIEMKGTPAEGNRPIIEDVPPGGKVVRVADSSRYAPGDIVGITEDNDYYVSWGQRGRGGVFKVVSVNHGTGEITIDRPLAIGLDEVARKNAIIFEFLQIENIAIENIRFKHTSTVDDNIIEIRWANNIMIKNCTFINSSMNHVSISQSRNMIVRDSYFYEAQRKEGGHGYTVVANNQCTGMLVTNNIFQDVNVCLGVQIGSSYVVYSYNLCIDRVKELCNSDDAPVGCGDRNWITDPEKNGIMEGDFGMGFTFHGHYPHSNLVEGNVIYGMVIDYIWRDNGPHNTVFRNKINGIPPFHTAYWLGGAAIHIDGPSDSQNIIGNVFMNDAFIEIGRWSYDSPRPAYDTFIGANVDADERIFFNDNTFRRADVPDWDDMVYDPELPDSLYLSEEPDFWPGSLEWPPFGPDVSNPQENKIPAELRYEKMQECQPLLDVQLKWIIEEWKDGDYSIPFVLGKVKEWKTGC